MANKTYFEKLKDPRWQKLRLKILERDDFACQICGDQENTLHIHHLAYSGNPWDAPDDTLLTLCEYCHGEETKDIKEATTNCINSLKRNKFMSVGFNAIPKIFETDRGWISYEPAFDILKMAVDDEHIWTALSEIFWQRVRLESKKRQENG